MVSIELADRNGTLIFLKLWFLSSQDLLGAGVRYLVGHVIEEG